MDYNLAKELKEAGFVYNQKRIMMGKYDKVYAPSSNEMLSADYELVPTLGQLIEVCGKEFHSLARGEGGYWLAYTHTQGNKSSWVEGKTPLEAVSRLWLALNKK